MLIESDVASMFGGASKPNAAYVLAKAYPSDSQNPVAGVYLNGSLVFSYSRDWHISVWDDTKGTWASAINFYGATQVVGSHARFDVYASGTRVAQQAAFVNTINALDERYTIIVGGSHAPEFYNEAMKAAIISIGGSSSNLSWSSRSSYFCVGRKGLPEGGAISEGVDNLAPEGNNGLTWARGDFFLGNAMSVSGCFEANVSEVGITRGLVAYYPLNKDARDYSGNASHGTVTGATLVGGGFDGQGAYRFSSGSTYVSLPNDVGYQDDVTVTAWFKGIGTPGNSHHIILGGQELEISIPTSGQLRTGVFTNARFVSNHGSGLLDGNWHHVAFNLRNGVKESFIDGVSVGTMTGVTGTLASVFSNRRIGVYGSSSSYYANGDICNVKIFNRALSPEEVAVEYKRTGPTKMTQHNGTVYIQGQIKETI